MASPAMRLLSNVWENGCKATSHSWDRVNCGMRGALKLAISAGLQFNTGDFSALSRFNVGRWIGDDGGEYLYTLAILETNWSFCLSFEKACSRQPFKAWGITGGHNHSSFIHASGINREHERLGVGLTFDYCGVRPTVTSFSGDGQSITACTYKPIVGDGDYRRRIDNRLTLTREQVKQDHEDTQWKQSLLVVPGPVPVESAEQFMSLTAKTRGEFMMLPRQKIERALKKLNVEV